MTPTTSHQPPATLSIAEGLELPLDFVGGTQAILGIKGSGKSHTASVQAEELLAAGQQIVVIDPTGAWWGLRSSKDGESAGYPVVVLGGHHGDMGLWSTSGRKVAAAVFRTSTSLILDLSTFNKTEQAVFIGALLEELYTLMDGSKIVHLFADEAHMYAPQGARGEKTTSAGAMEAVVSRGRIKGIGVTMITQRPQKLNKDVLTQADTLCCHRLGHPLDIAAVKEWVGDHSNSAGNDQEMVRSLASLPTGEAWVWSPLLGIFGRYKIRDRKTFDSGKTPQVGVMAAVPRKLASVDIESLREALRDEPPVEAAGGGRRAAGKATAEVPLIAESLQRRIHELQAELQEARATVPSAWLERAGKFLRIDIEKLTQQANRVKDDMDKLLDRAKMLNEGWELLVKDLTDPQPPRRHTASWRSPAPRKREGAKVGHGPTTYGEVMAHAIKGGMASRINGIDSSPRPGSPREEEQDEEGQEDEGRAGAPLAEAQEAAAGRAYDEVKQVGGACGVAIAAVLLVSKLPEMPVVSVAIRAGYSYRSGHFKDTMRAMRRAGLVEFDKLVARKGPKLSPDFIAPSPIGQRAADLRAFWAHKVGKCGGAVLGVLAAAKRPLPPVTVGLESGYSADSGHFKDSVRELRRLGLILPSRDPIELCKELRS